MINRKEFFNFNPHQSVNGVLVGILLASWFLWMFVYYLNRGVSVMEANKGGIEELNILLSEGLNQKN